MKGQILVDQSCAHKDNKKIRITMVIKLLIKVILTTFKVQISFTNINGYQPLDLLQIGLFVSYVIELDTQLKCVDHVPS